MPTLRSVMALDVGTKRIGVAVSSLIARLPRPLVTLTSSGSELIGELSEIIKSEYIDQIVVGMPRGLEGQNTAQTEYTFNFVKTLRQSFKLPIDLQDEALTSKKAEQELDSRGKPYKPADIDSLAATYILEDWFASLKENSHS